MGFVGGLQYFSNDESETVIQPNQDTQAPAIKFIATQVLHYQLEVLIKSVSGCKRFEIAARAKSDPFALPAKGCGEARLKRTAPELNGRNGRKTDSIGVLCI